MKTIKPKFTLILFSVFLSIQITKAQQQQPPPHFVYTYDDAGNRIQRIYVPYRLAAPKDSLPLAKDYLSGYAVTIYPNPTKGALSINITGNQEIQNAKIEVFDHTGKLVFSKQSPQQNTDLDLVGQPNGIYYLKIFIDNKSKQWQIVKTE